MSQNERPTGNEPKKRADFEGEGSDKPRANPTPPNREGDTTTGQEPTAKGEHLRKERAPTTNQERNKPPRPDM